MCFSRARGCHLDCVWVCLEMAARWWKDIRFPGLRGRKRRFLIVDFDSVVPEAVRYRPSLAGFLSSLMFSGTHQINATVLHKQLLCRYTQDAMFLASGFRAGVP